MRLAPQHDGFRQVLRPIQLGLQILVVLVVGGHVLVHRLGLVELALAFEVQRQVVQVAHDGITHWHAAKAVECGVELLLPLQGQALIRLVSADSSSDFSLPASVTRKRLVVSARWPMTSNTAGSTKLTQLLTCSIFLLI